VVLFWTCTYKPSFSNQCIETQGFCVFAKNEFIALTQENVSLPMNNDLCKDFTDDEISDDLFQIGPLKAPGVDGFLGRFYQRNWGTISAV
jgi:hypothetical protein